MSTDCGLRGLDLLDAAIERIEQHPETWVQGSYRCGSGMCVAGHVGEMAGGEWSGDSQYMVAVPEDDPAWLQGGTVHVSVRAARLLGARFLAENWSGDEEAENDLFGPDNTLADLKAMRDHLRARAAAEVTS